MARSSYGRVCLAWMLLLGFTSLAAAADEFAAPPKAERDFLAAVAKRGGRVQVDAEYRIVSVSLGAECTNDDLKGLADCERLSALTIASRNITDVETLKGLTKLTSLTLQTSGISTEGAAALRTALPNCRVTVLPGGPGGTRGGSATARSGGGGPGGGFGGSGSSTRRRPDLLRLPAVQEDLKLSPDQKEVVSAANATAALVAYQRAQEEMALAVLSPEQQTRLKQLELQQLGLSVLYREDIAKQLEVTAEQQAALRKLWDDAAAEVRTVAADAFRSSTDGAGTSKLQERMLAISKARDEKILAALNDKQREGWKALVGPPGPVLPTTFAGGFRGRDTTRTVPLTSAEVIKGIVALLDKDGDGSITDAELPATYLTREALTRAGVELKLPISREEFEKIYGKYLEESRARRE